MYLKTNPAKFHPHPIISDAALGFFEDGRRQQEEEEQSEQQQDN